MEIVSLCQMITENIFKEHLWGKCCNSLAFCALLNCFVGMETCKLSIYCSDPVLQLRKTPPEVLSFRGFAIIPGQDNCTNTTRAAGAQHTQKFGLNGDA